MTQELTLEDLDTQLDQVWTLAGGSSTPAVACFCGKCGAFNPKTYVSYSRIVLIGKTVLSQCCTHRLVTHSPNLVSWCTLEEPVDVTLEHSGFPSALEACDVMPSRGNGREEVDPSGQTGDADALQLAEEA